MKPRHAGRYHQSLYGLATLTALAGVAVLPLGEADASTAGAATASTARPSGGCVSEIKVPNGTVTASSPGLFYWVRASLVQACGASDAKWDADYYTSSTPHKAGSWDFHPIADPWPLSYANGHLGSYQAVPTGAVDGAGNPVPQATTSFAIKLGSRVRIKGYRIGRVVHLRAHVSRFNWLINGGYGAWQRSVNRDVKFYEWSRGGWVLVGSLHTRADGWTRSFNILAPSGHSFHAHAMQTPTIWGARSPNLGR